MNIFATSTDPWECAQALDDKRVNNQLRETGQLLCSALLMNGIHDPAFYALTHQDHPVTKWVAATADNWLWTLEHFKALDAEKLIRWPDNPRHLTGTKLMPIFDARRDEFSLRLPGFGRQPLPNCAANRAKGFDFTGMTNTQEAYQLYLVARWVTDTNPPKWTNRGEPTWN